MAKADIWMPVYIGDYLRDTEELNAEEHGAYFLLLMHYWLKGGEIGADISRLSRVARTSEETARFILGYYFTLEDGNYKNKRADKEIGNAQNRRDAARENGQKGGRPPGNNPRITGGLTDGLPGGEPGGEPESNPRKSSSSSSSSSQEDKKENIILAPLEKIEQKPKSVAKVKKEPDPLYTAIFQSFIGKSGAFTNYPKEAQAIKRIIKYCEQYSPRYTDGDKIKLAELAITKFFELTQNGDRFWRGQPFTPSSLSSSGIFDRVLVEIGQASQEEIANDIPF